jgi:hypothetical protein
MTYRVADTYKGADADVIDFDNEIGLRKKSSSSSGMTAGTEDW